MTRPEAGYNIGVNQAEAVSQGEEGMFSLILLTVEVILGRGLNDSDGLCSYLGFLPAATLSGCENLLSLGFLHGGEQDVTGLSSLSTFHISLSFSKLVELSLTQAKGVMVQLHWRARYAERGFGLRASVSSVQVT